MKQLLERWSQLEPHLCRQDFYGDYQVELNSSMVFIDLGKITGLAMVQWAVQQAIIEKGWYFEISYNKSNFNATVYSKILPNTHTANTSSEALLSAYLETFNGNS